VPRDASVRVKDPYFRFVLDGNASLRIVSLNGATGSVVAAEVFRLSSLEFYSPDSSLIAF
jgi:hypothetical protein